MDSLDSDFYVEVVLKVTVKNGYITSNTSGLTGAKVLPVIASGSQHAVNTPSPRRLPFKVQAIMSRRCAIVPYLPPNWFFLAAP